MGVRMRSKPSCHSNHYYAMRHHKYILSEMVRADMVFGDPYASEHAIEET